jgi:hypothetical protein
MVEIAHFAPVRIFLSALICGCFGLAFSLPPIVLFFLGDQWSALETTPLWVLGVPFLLKSLTLVRQSFIPGCYFRAGPEGIAIRLGVSGLYSALNRRTFIRISAATPDTFFNRYPGHWAQYDGASYIYQFQWSEIKGLENAGPNRTLYIELHAGPRLSVARYYFSENTFTITSKMMAYVPEVTDPIV